MHDQLAYIVVSLFVYYSSLALADVLDFTVRSIRRFL